jgi:cellulose synthase/poly-beta-1,6-N-acetylglucosamine synthase-like glycosyltransferase
MIIISLFWICLFLLVYSYVFYPLILQFLGRNKHNNALTFNQTDNLPFLSILLSVYNEELWIEQRIHNFYTSNYPKDKFEILVGSDGSSDNTNNLLTKLSEKYSSLHIYLFNERAGKANVINRLTTNALGDILILTDAKVLFSPNVLFQLSKHFKNAEIGIVGGNIVTKSIEKSSISAPEKKFINYEIRMKYNEGRLWGTTIGTYGACYAIRKKLFTPFPEGLTVDDFYSNMRVLDSGKQAILEINALCFENVPNLLLEEFRRKIRISSGNFQNLNYFKHLLLKPNATGFCFFSHKVLRWIGPFLLILIYITNLLLVTENLFYFYTLVLQLIIITIPLIDFFLHYIRIDILILRFITHFYTMNLALLIGLVKHLKGVKTNVWEPTKRQFFKA